MIYRNNTNKFSVFFIILIFFTVLLQGCTADTTTVVSTIPNSTSSSISDFLTQPFLKVEPVWKPVEVKAIYLTGFSAGNKKRFEQLLNLVNSTELNAMVIDIKDEDGLTYNSKVPLAQEIGSNTDKIDDLESIVNTLNENNIYSIARIVVFKDKILPFKIPELAVKHKNGGIWKDRRGIPWADPYNKEVWEYNIALAEEAARLGFKEIQFDYVRFPSDGKLSDIVYDNYNGISRSETICEFLDYARERLGSHGIYVSADIFGLVNSAQDDMGIGQVLEDIAKSADSICPMVYPSHYAPGSYGIQDPDSAPYQTVYASLNHAVRRLNKLESEKAVVRPWLQDFTLGHRYGPAEVRAQIKAVYDAGLKEWILWNPSNYYNVGALKSE